MHLKSISFLVIAVAVSTLFAGGCATKKTAPHIGFGNFDIQTTLSRDDIVVLERVEGTSETESILLGTVQVIDGENLKILGISFFKDKFTCVKSDPCLPEAEDRAYHKALEATPEADAVFYKTMDRENGGIPLIWETKKVTFSGKAVTLKADQPRAESEHSDESKESEHPEDSGESEHSEEPE